MKILILPIAFLGAIALSGCERTVVTPPNAAVVTTPPAVIATPVPVPGPSGPPGPQGDPGKPGNTSVVVVPTPSEPAKN